MNRIKVKFEDLTLRLENVPKDSRTGVGVEVRVKEYVLKTKNSEWAVKHFILE